MRKIENYSIEFVILLINERTIFRQVQLCRIDSKEHFGAISLQLVDRFGDLGRAKIVDEIEVVVEDGRNEVQGGVAAGRGRSMAIRLHPLLRSRALIAVSLQAFFICLNVALEAVAQRQAE